MLQITYRHVAAFAVARLDDALREQILRELVELEHCEAESLEDPALREQLGRQIELAAEHGVTTREGYVAFLSHHFVFGEDWMTRPAARGVLNGVARSEDALLDALYGALSNPRGG